MTYTENKFLHLQYYNLKITDNKNNTVDLQYYTGSNSLINAVDKKNPNKQTRYKTISVSIVYIKIH
jgi:hypothetical protein